MEKKTTIPPNTTKLRHQAEAKLNKRKKKDGSLTMNVDTKHLVHELEVYQIEVEMQNEELARSHDERDKTESLLHQYSNLYDFAPIGYFTLSRNGTICQVNLSGATLLGIERSRLINRRFGIFVSNQSRTTFNAFLDKVFIIENKEACEVFLLKDGTDLLWVRIEATIEDEQRETCRIVVMDITEHKHTEEQLRCLSTHDALTGLYNCGFFIEEMARFERGRAFPISIVVADVDRLKEINDHHGHAAGDAMLKRVAQVLTAAFRADDIIARLGGDEFAVLLPNTNATVVENSLQRVRQIIEKNNASHTEMSIHISFGMSTAEQWMPLSSLFTKADANMYREKREHNGY
ncbi:MAG: GGDEF domain-containing protein [Candidatus Desantisbacteria bacterium]